MGEVAGAVHHKHLSGSSPRHVLRSSDPSTDWLADLIEATEVVAASAEPCDPAIMNAFRDHLSADVRPLFEPSRMGTTD